jgi:hypothetical protein
MYIVADDAIQRIAGRVGLNVGTIPEDGDMPILGIGIIGGAD